MNKVHRIRDNAPSVAAASGFAPVMLRTVFRVYRGLVPMSPKTTPSAAKLKPAAPIAETELRFSAEILATCIATDHSISRPTPVLELGSSMTIGGSRRSVSARSAPLIRHSITYQAHLIGDREHRKAPNSDQKAMPFFESSCFAFSFFVSCLRPMPLRTFCALVN